MEVLEAIQSLFIVDYYLPRTFMACLRLEETAEVIKSGKMPVDVCCASLNFFLKDLSPRYQYPFQITNGEKVCS